APSTSTRHDHGPNTSGHATRTVVMTGLDSVNSCSSRATRAASGVSGIEAPTSRIANGVATATAVTDAIVNLTGSPRSPSRRAAIHRRMRPRLPGAVTLMRSCSAPVAMIDDEAADACQGEQAGDDADEHAPAAGGVGDDVRG